MVKLPFFTLDLERADRYGNDLQIDLECKVKVI